MTKQTICLLELCNIYDVALLRSSNYFLGYFIIEILVDAKGLTKKYFLIRYKICICLEEKLNK